MYLSIFRINRKEARKQQKPIPLLKPELHSAIKQAVESASLPPLQQIGQIQGPGVGNLLPTILPNVMNNAAALQLQQILQQNLPMMIPQQQNIHPIAPAKKKAGPGRPKGSGSQLSLAGISNKNWYEI